MTTTPESLIAEVDSLDVEATKASWTPYPDYRDTGADWLGRVPQHWGEKRLKYAVDLINDKTDDSDGLQYIGLEQIEPWTGRLIEPETPIVPDGTACRFEADDVLFGKLRPYLAKAYRATARGVCTAEALVLRSRDTIPDYLRYYLLTRQFIEVVDGSTYGSKMPRANWQFIGALPCLLPPPEEQKAISAFLDRKTREIDELIEKKRRLIELLQEQRIALISHAVTKGLDPDAPMKPSGVEWLGDVPEHWSVKRLKYIVDDYGPGIQMGPFGTSLKDLQYFDTGYKVYGQENTIANDFDLGSRWLTPEQFLDLAKYELKSGDIVLTRKGSIGQCRLVPGNITPGIADSDTIRVRLDPTVMVADLLVCMLHEAVHLQSQIYSVRRGAILGGLNTATIANLWLAIPPHSEQYHLVEFIAEVSQRFDAKIDAARSTIDRLSEYRQALISAAVTGKFDVREVVT